MKMPLTTGLLQFLIHEGYVWSLSKTRAIEVDNASVEITLTPVKTRPVLSRLPKGSDTYFHNKVEPRRLAEGIDDTQVFIDVDEELLCQYHAHLQDFSTL